jgi:hypothetical protein
MGRVKRLAMLPDHIAKKMEHLQVRARRGENVHLQSLNRLPAHAAHNLPWWYLRLSNTRNTATTNRILIPSPR